MKNTRRDGYILRKGIMNLLSDEEVARVSTSEGSELLQEGEEYLDLERLEEGVRLATGDPSPMGGLLPKKAVHQETWTKILVQLTGPYVRGATLNQSAPTPRNT